MYISSMSKKLKDIGAELDSKARTLVLHLIKIIMYPHHGAQNHWFQEIYSAIHDIDYIKGSNKLPKSDFIYSNILGNHGKMISKYLNIIQKDYGPSESTIDDATAEFYIENYCKWLSQILSSDGVVARTDVYSYLTDMVEDVKSNYC